MILSCSNISKAFGTEEILKHVSFHVEDHEKAAIVGINGAGKSTLLKIIVGELAADEGSVTITKGKTLGYLAQHQDLHSQTTIYDSLLEVKRPILEMEQQIRTLELQMKHAEGEKLETMLNTYSRLNHEFELLNGYAWQSEITGVLKGLGFVEEEFSKPVSELSGGQKTRVSLGKLLLSKPDIILLDEPTNHLDMESIAWLETYLMNYAGTVIIVAHDRYFLDRVVTKIVELDGGIATSFQGNYTAYSEKKAIIRAGVLKAYLNQQQEIRHQEEVITKLKSFNREKSIKRAESREKMLSKMDLLEKPTEINDAMHITLEPCVTSGNDVLSVRELAKSFDGMTLFTDLNFEVKRGEAWGLIGTNGSGKSTLLKLICGILKPYRGTVEVRGSIAPLIELGAGFDGELTATENIYLNGAVLGYSKEFMDAHYDEIVEFAELKDFMNMPIKNYSSGMAARLGFAIATIVQPEILIVDEVLAVGDAAFQEKCQERMHHMLENGTTLLFVSHTMATVRQLCDHAIWLNKGDVVMQGEAEGVCNAYMESLNLPDNA